jgi:hypothetical protein
MLRGWKKTTPYTARITGGGSQKRRINRSNVVIVASVENQGPYDYKCPGLGADEGFINYAMQYVSETFGGGVVHLTAGRFYIDNHIDMFNGVILEGEGNATIIEPSNKQCFYVGDVKNAKLSSFTIDYDGDSPPGVIYINDTIGGSSNSIENISIIGISSPSNMTVIEVTSSVSVKNCFVDDLSGSGVIIGIKGSVMVLNNTIGAMASSGPAYGMSNCTKCQQNRVASATTAKYLNSYADSGTTYPCADDADGGFNS